MFHDLKCWVLLEGGEPPLIPSAPHGDPYFATLQKVAEEGALPQPVLRVQPSQQNYNKELPPQDHRCPTRLSGK